MNDNYTFMIFGVLIALAGFFLAATARAGRGQTTIKIFGAEITLAAAGGIVVMLMGILTFALPTTLSAIYGLKPPAIIAKPSEKDEESPKDQKAVEALLSNGPSSPSQISAYFSSYSQDIIRYTTLDYGGASLIEVSSNKRSINFWFSLPGKATDGMKNIAMQRISQQLCLTTGLRRAINEGGSARIEITDTPAEDIVNLIEISYLDCK